MFGHAFKGQKSAPKLLSRFRQGQGALFDLEYLVNDDGRRVAAFGFAAGSSGMGVGLLAWSWQQRLIAKRIKVDDPVLPPLTEVFSSYDHFAEKIRAELKEVGRIPTVHIIGAFGRVGSGAISFANRFNIQMVKWDQENTSGRLGPFPELFESDIFVNGILLAPNAPPMKFITAESLGKVGENRRLTLIADVSCDPFNPMNPLPIYDDITTLERPTRRLVKDPEHPLDIVAIDHLPSLVPAESSREFADSLLPHLLLFGKTQVWSRAAELFQRKSDELLGAPPK
jgi:saccharopine dehydrogenase (NAD+, L-lysine-forming)